MSVTLHYCESFFFLCSEDINECQEGMPLKCLPEAECVNNYGSYFCRCPKGLEGDGLANCIGRWFVQCQHLLNGHLVRGLDAFVKSAFVIHSSYNVAAVMNGDCAVLDCVE